MTSLAETKNIFIDRFMAHEILHLDKTTRGSRDARTPHARRDYRLASREICFSIYTLSDLGNSSNRIG